MFAFLKNAKTAMLCGVLSLGLMVGLESAQAETEYPTKSVKIVVPFPPGGSTDALARFVGEQLQAKWGQPVVVENRPGALGAVGTEAVKKSAPDGYTILLGASYLTIAPNLYPSLPYDPQKDIVPLGVGMETPLALYASSTLGVKTLNDLTALLKAKPDGYNFASAGNGTVAHIAAEIFQRKMGVQLTHIPYQGTAPALLDVIAGRSQLIVEAVAAGKQYVKSGQLVPILVTSEKPVADLPDVETAKAAGLQDLEIKPWNVFFVPANTDKSVVDKLNADLTAVFSSPSTTEWMKERSTDAVLSTPAEFSQRIDRELAKMREIITAAGIKAN